jgi:Phosphotransferase enzyme family
LDAGQARSRRQFAGQQMFAPLGLAPQPLWYDRHPTGLSRQILVYRWAPGALIDPANPAQLVGLAQSVAQLHSGDPSAVDRFSPNPLNLDYLWRILHGGIGPVQGWLHEQGATALLALFTQLVAAAEQVVVTALPWWVGVPPAPVHGELRLENVIDSFGAAVLLDWEMFGLGDPALEAASFLYLSQGELTKTMQMGWLEHYLAHVDQAGLAQRIAVYQTILPLQAVCFLLSGLRDWLHRANLPPAQAENLTFLRATLIQALQQATSALQIAAAADIDLLVQPLWGDGNEGEATNG